MHAVQAPSKRARCDQKHFGYDQLWPLWPAYSPNWARLYMLDPSSCIQFSSVFPKKAQIILCKTSRILAGWPGQVLAKQIWSGSKNHLAQFCEMPTGLQPISHFQTQLHSSTEGLHHNYCAEPTQIWFWLTVLGFGQFGPLLASASEPVWI